MSQFPDTVGHPVKHRPEKSLLRELLEISLGTLVMAALIWGFVARSFVVHGPSMEPTLASGERLLVDQITYRFRDPARGEIIVLRNPGNVDETYIKRVIGVPGDVIMVRGGILYVNGRPVEEPYIKARMFEDFGPYEVPEDHFFVMGDNRNNSMDSRRVQVGPIPRDHIIGRALIRFWPPSRVGLVGGEAELLAEL